MDSLVRLRPDRSHGHLSCPELGWQGIGQEENRILRLRYAVRLFFQEMEKGTREASQAAGYEYVLVDQKSSESTMVSATQYLINQGISALIISPFKPDAVGPIVDAAKEKKIPVVVDDIGGGGTDYDVIVISDNEKGGILAARSTSTPC
jgi:ABC-type sugar transport system substrate-binding protein